MDRNKAAWDLHSFFWATSLQALVYGPLLIGQAMVVLTWVFAPHTPVGTWMRCLSISLGALVAALGGIAQIVRKETLSKGGHVIKGVGVFPGIYFTLIMVLLAVIPIGVLAAWTLQGSSWLP